MKYEITPNGNLKISVETDDEREDIAKIRERNHSDSGIWCDILAMDNMEGNGRFCIVRPEDIGALTEAPIITDDWLYHDDGWLEVRGHVWWYPNYMVSDPSATLLAEGSAIFTLAPESA